METPDSAALFLSASQTLKLAIEQERQKPQYAATDHDPCLMLWMASAVKQANPAAFDLENPADLLIWSFVTA